MVASKYSENIARKKSKTTDGNKTADTTAKKTVAAPSYLSMTPKKGESLTASLFADPGHKGFSKTSFLNVTLPHKMSLPADDEPSAAAVTTPASGLNPAGKQTIQLAKNKPPISPIGGDTKKFLIPSKAVGAGNFSPTASTTPSPRTSIVEPGRKSVKLDASASIGHQSFGRKALELFSWGSKRTKSPSNDAESNMAKRLGKKSGLQINKTADIKKGSVFFPSMQDVKVMTKVDVARESAMPSLDALSALKNRTMTHYSEFINADDLTGRARRVAKRQKIASCVAISIIFLVLAFLLVYFLGLISLPRDLRSHNATKKFQSTVTTIEELSTHSLTRVTIPKVTHRPSIIPSDFGNDVSKLTTTKVPAGLASVTNTTNTVVIRKSIAEDDGDKAAKRKKGRTGDNYSTTIGTGVTMTNIYDFDAKTSLLKLDDDSP